MDWKDKLKDADVDVDGAILRFSNKEDRYVKYLKLFKCDTSFLDLKQAVGLGDSMSAFESCHTLKGIVGNLGFNKMYKVVYNACESLRKGKLDGVDEMIDEISENYAQIIKVIEEDIIE